MNTLLPRFSSDITAATSADISADPTLGGRLVLECDRALAVTYAPFDYVNPSARIVLVGITPGRQQAVNALLEARRQLVAGNDLPAVAKAAKETASFSGPMRTSLVDMLDFIDLPRWLGIPSCGHLFGARADLVHYTSALRYPVYVNGQNYSGAPAMVSTPLLRQQIETHLAAEAHALPNAVWIPLGPAPTSALDLLARQGILSKDRILDGLPHPSGANGERISYFLGRKARELLSSRTNAALIDEAQARLMDRIRKLAA
jgi:hypothetical protein